MSLLLDLMTRLRTVPAREMPSIPRCVLHVVADHWNAERGASWPKVETIAQEAGCSESAARIALAELVGAGWLVVVAKATPRDSARFEVRLDGRPLPVRVPSRGTQKPGRVPGATTQGAATEHPGCREQPPRVPRGTPEALREAPIEAQKKPPSRPHARAGGQQSLLPDLETCTATGTPLPASGVREKPAKSPREKTAGERYADAFVQAFTDRGRTVSRPTTNEATLIGKLCRDHARDRAGVVLVGDALPVWIRAQVGAMLDGVDDPTRHRGGLSVIGLRHWLDTVGPVRVRELDPPPPARPAPEAPRALNRPPSNVTLEEAIAAIRANPYFPQPERTIAGLQAKIAIRDAAKTEGQAAHG